METPELATIDRWTELSGVSRSTTYEMLGAGTLKAHKLNKRVLIDVPAGLAYLRSLPAPNIRAAHRSA
jgi:hypothetical protein